MVAELKEVILKVERLEDEEQRRNAKMLEDEIKFENSLQGLKPNAEYDEVYLKVLEIKQNHGLEQ